MRRLLTVLCVVVFASTSSAQQLSYRQVANLSDANTRLQALLAYKSALETWLPQYNVAQQIMSNPGSPQPFRIRAALTIQNATMAMQRPPLWVAIHTQPPYYSYAAEYQDVLWLIQNTQFGIAAIYDSQHASQTWVSGYVTAKDVRHSCYFRN